MLPPIRLHSSLTGKVDLSPHGLPTGHMTKGKTTKVQRNPECMIVNCAPPIELVAKVRTAIAGRMVPWWTMRDSNPRP
ncbi:MAG: hypothetical protein SPG40_08025 [Kiritimatiellia bacterium]|nr:hypothetical protein [Kiritimatiellia bacterium]